LCRLDPCPCGSKIELEFHHEIYPTKANEILQAVAEGKIYRLCKKCHGKLRRQDYKDKNRKVYNIVLLYDYSAMLNRKNKKLGDKSLIPKMAYCANCGKNLERGQLKTCSLKCKRQYVSAVKDMKRRDAIIKALKSLKSEWVSKRVIQNIAGGIDYHSFERTFKQIEKEGKLMTLISSRGFLYKLKR
jgi:hypothetical protein